MEQVVENSSTGTGDGSTPVNAAAELPANATGTLLRATREAQGLSIGDIANRLRMGVKQVSALENGDYSALPTGTFLRGFVRNYAKTLHLSTDEVLAHLEKDHASARPLKATPVVVPAQQNIKVPTPGGELATPSARIAISGLVVCLLFGAVWYWWVYVRPHRAEGGRPPITVAAPAVIDNAVSVPLRPPDIAPALGPVLEPGNSAAWEAEKPAGLAVVPPALAPAPTPLPVPVPSTSPGANGKSPSPTTTTTPAAVAPAKLPSPSIAAPSPTATGPNSGTNAAGQISAASAASKSPAASAAPAKSASSVLGFTFSGESWVEVVDGSGKTVLSKRFRAGDAEEVAGRPPFSVVVGNAQVTRMAVNGREFDLTPHSKFSVARVAIK
jgi:cytoskeleton protein RodZ